MTERNGRASYSVLTLLPLALSAQEPTPPPRVAALRLSEQLASARIESPLTALQPARSLADLGDPDTDVLLDEGFEEFDWDFAEWPKTPGVEVAAEGEGQVLRLATPTDAFLGWVLPVRSDAFYRFERAVRVRGKPFCDLCVVESRAEPEQARLDARLHFLAGRGLALKIHRLPIRSGEEERGWQRDGTSFYPTPRTRSLIVLIRADVGSGDRTASVRGMEFDDVRLVEIAPDRTERMRLLMGADAAADAGPHAAMRKA